MGLKLSELSKPRINNLNPAAAAHELHSAPVMCLYVAGCHLPNLIMSVLQSPQQLHEQFSKGISNNGAAALCAQQHASAPDPVLRLESVAARRHPWNASGAEMFSHCGLIALTGARR